MTAQHSERAYSVVGIRLNLLLIFFILLLMGDIAYVFVVIQTRTTDTLVSEIAARQRMLIQRHFNELILSRKPGDGSYLTTREELKASVASLLEGGPVSDLTGDTGIGTIPPLPTPELRQMLEAHNEVLNELFQTTDLVVERNLRSTLDEDFVEELGMVHNQAALSADRFLRDFNQHTENHLIELLQIEVAYLVFIFLFGAYLTYTIRKTVTFGLEKEVAERREIQTKLQDRVEQLREARKAVLNMMADIDATNHDLEAEISQRKRFERELKRSNRLVRLLNEITVAANESDAPESAYQIALEKIRGFTGWPVGHVLTPSEGSQEVFGSSGIWSVESEESFGAFKRSTESVRFASGQGIPGRVLSTQKPVWRRDVRLDPTTPRAKAATQGEVKSGFGFPVFVGEEIVAILEFFTTKTVRRDKHLLSIVSQLGIQLGRVVERRRAIEETSRLARCVESATEAVLITSPDANIQYVNPAFEKITGFPRGEAIGKNPRILKSGVHDNSIYHELWETLTRGEVWSGSLTNQKKDGTLFDADQTISPVLDEAGRVLNYVSVMRDTTERNRARAALEGYAKDLERLNDDLEKQNRELDEFTYLASHDLQEPLRKLVAFSNLLQRDLGGNIPEKVKTDLEYISSSASRMQTMVQDLLSLSRAGRSEMRSDKVSLQDCISKALDNLSVRIEETEAEILQDEFPEVEGDQTLLTHLFQNLIGNSLKFTNGKHPQVHLTVKNEQGNTVFGVRDSGIGIKKEYCEQIFSPFKRLHGRAEYEGTGIGLSICRKAVERHGGRIWVESEPGKGSHFQFTLSESED